MGRFETKLLVACVLCGVLIFAMVHGFEYLGRAGAAQRREYDKQELLHKAELCKMAKAKANGVELKGCSNGYTSDNAHD